MLTFVIYKLDRGCC